jgi:hypothetical protein
MRYIPIETFTPSEEWQQRASNATERLMELTTLEEKLEYIKRHGEIWRDLGRELIAHFGDKCWYTDATNYGARLDTEHFRPKAKTVELSPDDFEEASDELLLRPVERVREGYWWLAFDLENLVICAQVMNREDKRNYFPLHRDSVVASNANRNFWRTEIPAFLDPRKIADVALVTYDESGSMRPRGDLHGWERLRVVVTNECFGLSRFQPLVEGRQKVWQKCTSLINRYMKAASTQNRELVPNPVLQQQMDDALRELRNLIHPDEQFASVAASCLRDSPYKWANTLASIPRFNRN